MGKKDDDELIRKLNEAGNNERAEHHLKSLLGKQFAGTGKKKGVIIDLGQLVSLLVTKAEFVEFKKTVTIALSTIEGLLKEIMPKAKDWSETADVLGRLLATLARKDLVSQDDIVETSKLILEGQRLVRELHTEHSDKTLDERLEIMRTESVPELAVEEYEHVQRKKAANRIVSLHSELKKPKINKDGTVETRAKTSKEIIEIIRAENLPEAQVREYIRAFFPWGDGMKGPGEDDVLFCPECDAGFASGMIDSTEGGIPECPDCGREVFPASEFVRPENCGGAKKQTEESETSEVEEKTKEVVEEPEIEEVEDECLLCPADVETATDHYDPSGPGAEKNEDGFSDCAGCGAPRSAHKRVVKLLTPTDEDLDEAEEGGAE